MKYIGLLILTICLAIILLPVGFICSMFYSDRLKHLYKICQGIDQLGNVVCAKLFDVILITKDGHPFGNEDEVISSVIGKNERAGTLTFVGKMLNWLLNAIDKNHTIKAIENFTITVLLVFVSSCASAQMQFHWRQIGGPLPTDIAFPDSANTLVKGLFVPGEYEYELAVTFPAYNDFVAKDSVIITVLPGTVLALRPDTSYQIQRPEIKELEIKVATNSSSILIQIKSPKFQKIECGLFDMVGRKIAKVDMKVFKGVNYMTVPKPKVKGIYILKFTTYFENVTKKIML